MEIQAETQTESTFGGGTVLLTVQHQIPEGRQAKYYHIYYVPLVGELVYFATSYNGEAFTYRTPHFSDYAIVYDESMENETGKAEKKEEEPASGQDGAGQGNYAVPYGFTPARPAVPKLVWADETYLVVGTAAGHQYSIDGGKTWQTGGIFTGLVPGQSYRVVTKAVAANGRSGSAISDALHVVLKEASADFCYNDFGSVCPPAVIKNTRWRAGSYGEEVSIWLRRALLKKYE